MITLPVPRQITIINELNNKLNLEDIFVRLPINEKVHGIYYDGNIRGITYNRNRGFYKCIHIYINTNSKKKSIRLFPTRVEIIGVTSVKEGVDDIKNTIGEFLTLDIKEVKECHVSYKYYLPPHLKLDDLIDYFGDHNMLGSAWSSYVKYIPITITNENVSGDSDDTNT